MKTKDILQIISKIGKISAYTLEILSLGQGSTYRNLRRAALDPLYLDRIQVKKSLNYSEKRKRSCQNFYNLISYLQKQGLVDKHKNKSNRNSYWVITKKGKEKLKNLNQRTNKDAPLLPKTNYKIEKDKSFNIVIFDIPEKERRKRDWLRFRLQNLKFRQLQKSVWIGNIKLPTEFLADLKDLNLLSYVEIFSINKTGTIKEAVK